MAVRFRQYTAADFLKVRDFLLQTHDDVGETYNWHIARWEFSRAVSQVFHETAELWEETTGIWEDESGCILAIASSEGEEEGEVHFQLARRDLPDELLIPLFEHAEARLAVPEAGRSVLRPRLAEGDLRLEAIARQRGFARTDRREVTLTIDPRSVPAPALADGFSIRDGREVGPALQSRVHAAAFQIPDDSEYIPRSRAAFRLLRGAPDYRPDLDIYVVNEAGEPVSFCCMWYDRVNRAGHLEPVGTSTEYRRMGFGRAAIYEGLRRIAAEGAIAATVGSNQQFYKSIGFAHLGARCIWEKTIA